MSSEVTQHNGEHRDLVLLYALQALSASEVLEAEAQIFSCAGCREELDAVQPIIASFVFWPTDVLRPSLPLWDRLAQKIAQGTSTRPTTLRAQPSAKQEWEEVAPGISCKLLATDEEHDHVSMLVRLAPGANYPPHRHAGVEELHLLDGELMIGDRKLYPGDYNRAEPHSTDYRVWSQTGCTCVLVTSTKDVIL
jgi:quercetin dioxygenase-like cupin family protein